MSYPLPSFRSPDAPHEADPPFSHLSSSSLLCCSHTPSSAIKELAALQKLLHTAAAAEAKSAKSHHEALKVEQKANVGYLKYKTIYDQAAAGLKAREEELEINKQNTARHNSMLEEQAAKVESLREAKGKDDRMRAERIGSIKRK